MLTYLPNRTVGKKTVFLVNNSFSVNERLDLSSDGLGLALGIVNHPLVGGVTKGTKYKMGVYKIFTSNHQYQQTKILAQ